MWIDRSITKKLLEASNRPVILLTGPRQTGKSSLLKKIYPDAHYKSLDKILIAEEAEVNPSFFLSKFNNYHQVILDEVQYAPSLFRELKSIVDNNREQYGKWILTGSQKFSLMNNVSESLAGRIRILHLETLSAVEIRQSSNVSQDKFINFIWQGGYPELWANPDLNSNSVNFFEDYVQTYLERDLRKIINVINLRDFQRFLIICATRVGQLLNFVDLSKDVGVSVNYIKKWITVLEASGIIYLLTPYYNNLGKRLVKAPKLYFADHGLLCYLLNIHNIETWEASTYRGCIWENLVFTELLKTGYFTPGRNIFFYRDQNGVEIDLILEINNKIILIEAKAQEKHANSKLNFNKVAGLFANNKPVSCFLACTADIDDVVLLKDYGIFNPLYFDLIQIL